MEILQYNGTHNLTATNRGATGIKYIAIHYTAGTTSKTGSAKNTCSWFMNSDCKGSADFIVDDTTIYQYNPKPETGYCWAVGGNANQYNKTTSLSKTMLGICKNSNSISIEICSTKSGNDYYFTDAVINKAVELTKYLMKKYNIDINHVVMHHHVTGKLCPQMWTKNEQALQGWNDFKEKITENEKEVEDMTKEETQKMIDQSIAILKKQLETITDITGTGDNPSNWAKPYTEWAKENGVFSGNKGDYGWQKPLTREQVAVIAKALKEG